MQDLIRARVFQSPIWKKRGQECPHSFKTPLKLFGQEYIPDDDYDGDELDRFVTGAGLSGKSSADWSWVQYMHTSLNGKGRAVILLDTCAASRWVGCRLCTRLDYRGGPQKGKVWDRRKSVASDSPAGKAMKLSGSSPIKPFSGSSQNDPLCRPVWGK